MFIGQGEKMINKRKIVSIVCNIVISVSAILGIFLACINATRDGYSSWYKRLLYFTQLSNIWIGVLSIVFLVIMVLEIVKNKIIIKDYLYILKYVFTVSITITGIIFCVLLAPFADFNVWTFSSILTHVVVPVVSIFDYFICDLKVKLTKKHIYYTLIPPLIYFVFASILCLMKVDFGRGDPYPYFFMNFYSEVGWFGYRNDGLPELGTFYWIIIIFLLILGLGKLYYKIHPATRKKK